MENRDLELEITVGIRIQHELGNLKNEMKENLSHNLAELFKSIY